jgi:hypothetical protein
MYCHVCRGQAAMMRRTPHPQPRPNRELQITRTPAAGETRRQLAARQLAQETLLPCRPTVVSTLTACETAGVVGTLRGRRFERTGGARHTRATLITPVPTRGAQAAVMSGRATHCLRTPCGDTTPTPTMPRSTAHIAPHTHVARTTTAHAHGSGSRHCSADTPVQVPPTSSYLCNSCSASTCC